MHWYNIFLQGNSMHSLKKKKSFVSILGQILVRTLQMNYFM